MKSSRLPGRLLHARLGIEERVSALAVGEQPRRARRHEGAESPAPAINSISDAPSALPNA